MNKEPIKRNIINLVIIEDNKFIRQGWEIIITPEKDIKLIGSFSSCEDAFNSSIIADAQLILMDIELPGISGIEGVKYLKENYPHIITIMCTVHEENDNIFNAICTGAVGYLLKKTSPAELLKAIRDANNGGSPMTPSVARKVIASFHKSITPKTSNTKTKLTEREEQILNLMALGKSYSTIAEEVFLSVDGVYYHIRHIYEKLQVHSRSEAVAEGYKKKIIKPPTQ